MTVTAKNPIKRISGSGWVNPLTHDFVLENSSYLKVYADSTLLTLGVDYSISGLNNPAGYSVTITNPGLTLAFFTLSVETPLTQEADVDQGGVFGARFEAALDAVVRRMQVVGGGLAYALRLPFTSAAPAVLAPEAGKVLGWGVDGELANVGLPPDYDDVLDALTDAQAAAAAAAASQSAAATSAGNASTQAGVATTQAALAAAQAAAAANSVAALAFNFDTATADADPGPGNVRLNNAAPGSATAIYIDNTDADAVSVSGLLDTWDDISDTTNRGTLYLRSKASAAIRYAFRVTGNVVDGSGYRKLTVTPLGGSGSLTAAMPCWVIFDASGPKGTDGVGSGDVVGPASSVSGRVATYNGTTGKLLQDGGTLLSDLAPKANASFTGTFSVAAGALAHAALANLAGVSVFGRSANSSGVMAAITAGADDRLLARTSSALSWVQLTIGMIPDALLTYAKLASGAIATAAELLAGTASKLVDAATVHSSMAWVAITAGASPAVDHAAGFNRTITHSANATFGAPSNAKPGMPLNIDITPAGFTTSWNAVYKFGGAGAPAITSRTLVHFICRDSTTFVFLGTSDPT